MFSAWARGSCSDSPSAHETQSLRTKSNNNVVFFQRTLLTFAFCLELKPLRQMPPSVAGSRVSYFKGLCKSAVQSKVALSTGVGSPHSCVFL